MDKNGYPEDHELEKIKTWEPSDLDGLMEYVESLWWHPDYGFRKTETGLYVLSTGGWSGNEDLIQAMNENDTWWSLFWLLSKRGGHYEFGVSRK